MAYIFKQHSTGIDNIQDWGDLQQFDHTDIATIPDTLDGGVLDKIGSSIPTPFSRMYLFDTAFSIANEKGGETNPIYKELISDCLDFIQFLYLKGNSGKLKFKIWNRVDQIKELNESTFNEHRMLGDALDVFFRGDKQLRNISDIVLIYFVYKDSEGIKEKLIGGTSPLTLVYTSPNWKEIAQANNWTQATSGKDILFDSIPCGIKERSDDFQEFLYKLIVAYSDRLPRSFYEFVFNNLNPRFGAIVTEYSEQIFLEEYRKIKFSFNGSDKELRINDCCLAAKNEKSESVIIASRSDFLLQPSNNNFTNELDANSNPRSDIRIPLVLCEGDHHSMKYIDENWDHRNSVPDDRSDVQSRELPGLDGVKYPYLTIGDFFEDKLLKLPFSMDRQRFVHARDVNGNPFREYALPIRKQYFNYLSLEDLERDLIVTETKEEVIYELMIAVKNKRKISFKKKYSKESDVLKPRFNMGLFPFYKITDNDKHNNYSIFLATEDIGFQTSFYKFDKVILKQPVGVELNQRTINAPIKTFSYTINESSFDFVEVVASNEGLSSHALIIPKMEQKSPSKAPHKYHFAIDFGTTNTHVVYATSNGLHSKDIFDLDFHENDRQMVLLSELDSEAKTIKDKVMFGMGKIIRDAAQYFNTEFVPGFISKDAMVSFPIRTVVAEHQSYLSTRKALLFGNLNIGFGFEGLNSRSENYHETNLKWSLTQGTLAVNRVHVFIREILWLIKNKCVLNDGKLNMDIKWMYPLSMGKNELNDLTDIWNKEIIKVFGSDNEITLGESIESIVPYYAIAELRAQNTLNIDIGGGTTDVLLFDKVNKKNYHTSFRFAGNDIWGEGVSLNRTNKDNGFVTIGEKELKGAEIETIFRHFKDNEKKLNSSDLCALLFKEGNNFNFTRIIRQHAHTKAVLYIHLAAIVYHISQILVELDMEIPELISFTGKGSKYLQILSSRNEDIREYVILLFEKYTGKKAKSITKVITNKDPKRITAEGALLQIVDAEKLERPNQLIYIKTNFDKEKAEDPTANLDVKEAENQEVNKMPLRKPLDELEIEHLDKVKTQLMEDFEIFLKSLEDRDVTNYLRTYQVPLSFRYSEGEGNREFKVTDVLRENAMVGFNEKVFQLQGSVIGDILPETPFFWFLKQGLYELSKSLANVKPI